MATLKYILIVLLSLSLYGSDKELCWNTDIDEWIYFSWLGDINSFEFSNGEDEQGRYLTIYSSTIDSLGCHYSYEIKE